MPSLKYLVHICLLNKYIKCNFRGQRCGTTTIVDIRRQKVNCGFLQPKWRVFTTQYALSPYIYQTRFDLTEREKKQYKSQIKI